MATFKMFLRALALVLFAAAFSPVAQAQEAEGDSCCNGTLNGKAWTEANFIDLGLQLQYGSQLYSVPNELESLSLGGIYTTGIYGWGTNEGEGIAGVTLKLGFQRTRATTDDGKDVGETPFVFAPGFLIGQFLGKRFILTEGANLLIANAGPGAELEIKGHVLLLNWLDIQFGVPLGFYRTGARMENGDQISTVGLGFLFGASVEFYGDYSLI